MDENTNPYQDYKPDVMLKEALRRFKEDSSEKQYVEFLECRVEFYNKVALYREAQIVHLRNVIEEWIKDVAYDINDFVVNEENVKVC